VPESAAGILTEGLAEIMQEFLYYSQIVLNYLRPVLEILILAFLIYKSLYYLRGTRGSSILAGLLIILLLLTVISDLIKFEVISWNCVAVSPSLALRLSSTAAKSRRRLRKLLPLF
jgi:DNA integrity scanning protein DisA with diadenylate cyclase activity